MDSNMSKIYNNVMLVPDPSEDDHIAKVKTVDNRIDKVSIEGRFLTTDGFGGLRYYNGHFQFYDKDTDTWVDTSVSPDNVYVFKMTPQPMKKIFGKCDVNTGYNKLKWEEPNDTIVEEQAFCIVEKVIIRRKLGSAPSDETDGDLVIEIERKDFGKYKNTWFVDTELTPNVGDVYYYKAFPMSTTGFYGLSTSNEVSIVYKEYELYGFKLDQNESDPSKMITYLNDCDNANYSSAYMDYTSGTFNYGSWKDAWFILDLKPCMLKYDGTVDYELDKNNYALKVDGTASNIADATYEGNAMVGFPKVYWKIVDNGDNTANVYISSKQLDDKYHCWSHIDNNGNEIDYCYMPIYNGSYADGRLRSLSGKTPIYSQAGTTEITYAMANNTGTDVIWYTELFNDRMLVNLLLLLIGKSTDTQTVFGNGHYTGGSSASALMISGTMNNKGLFYGTDGTGKGVKVFGIEHWWGNIWRRIGGLINSNGTQKIKLTYGQSDGSTVDGYNTDGNGYIALNNSTPSGTSGGYINKLLISNYGLFPITVSGSSTTYYTDGLWFNNSLVAYAASGGDSYNVARDGALMSCLLFAVSFADWDFGASLSCKPLSTP